LQYQLDGAFPTIKIAVEADSKTFHSSPEKIVSDKQRDMALAAQGWTVLRFTEEEIQEQPQDVINVLTTVINRKSSGNSSGANTI
jgi:very-short-patch-repair endonuclease